MTVWLDFRTESTVEPEVEVKWGPGEEGKEYMVWCWDDNCGWHDVAFSPVDAIDTKHSHIAWHLEGCPQ